MQKSTRTSGRSAGTGRTPAYRRSASAKKTRNRRAGTSRNGAARTARRRVHRRSEAFSIIVGSLVVAAVLMVGLGVLALFTPQLRLARAHSLVTSGQLDAADNLINVLESEGAPEDRIALLRLELAEQHVRAARYADALALAEDLPAGARLEEVVNAAHYGQAAERYDAEDYEDAAQRFYQLGSYGDSAQRYVDCRCALAVLTYLSGDGETARKRLIALERAPERIEGVVRRIADTDEEAEAMLAMDIFNGPALARLQKEMARLSAARAAVKAGRVAAGYRHTVGLRSDGRVLAAGNDSYGQCRVSEWTDVIQVAAGAKHTLGLRTDGTVLAAGDNGYKQCDVSGWRDITAVAANAYGSFGLKSDGTVVATGKYANRVSGWHGVTLIAAGSYSAACLYAQDGMLCTHPGGRLSSSAGLTSLSICGPVSAGIDEDGALVTNYKGAPKWKNLVSVAVGENGFVGVTRDGKAASFFFRGQRTSEIEMEGSAVEAAASGTHMVVMTEDGRVFAFGLNDQGQCNVSDWRL